MWRGHEGVILTQDALSRRAAGRHRRNELAKLLAFVRRCQLARLLAEGITNRTELAITLDVSRATIHRDIAALFQQGPGCCPTCGRPYAPRDMV